MVIIEGWMTNHFSPLHQFSLIGNGYVERSAEKSSEAFSRFDRKNLIAFCYENII